MSRRVGTRIVIRALAALAIALIAFAPRLGIPVLAASATVHIADTLDPSALTVTPGTTVTWVNDSGDRHRMRSTSGPSEFDSGDMEPGQTFTHTFPGTGTWQYVDDRNKDLSNYWGTVTVADTPTPTPKPTATSPPGSTPAPTQAPPPGDILMAGRAFRPAALTVDAGTVVRWRNNDTREHTVTSTTKAFDSGIMPVGATFTRTFTTAGSFGYLCAIHPDMTGTITVRPAAGATPPPTPKPTPRPTPAPTPAPGSGGVSIVDFAFTPASLAVVAGTTVVWHNNGAALHTVTATDGSWDSGLVSAGGTFSRRFGAAGTFLYLCSLHPSMTGVVRVSGANGATPPPPPPPTPKPTPPPVTGGALELRDFAFVPSAIHITPGTTVTWINTGAAPHTVTDRAGAFDSGILNRGARYSRTFASPGTYQLLCSIHPDMHATLTVAAPGATAPPPSTPAPVVTPPPGSGVVAIVDFDFAPAVLRVPVGTTVRWVNQGVAPHTVTAVDRSFDSGFLSTGDSYTRTFSAQATIEYLCAIHPAMVGTVVVGGAAGPAPSTAPSVAPGSVASPGPSASPPAAGTSGASAAARAGGAAGSAGPTDSTGLGAVPVQAGMTPVLEAPMEPLGAESLLRIALVMGLGTLAVGAFVTLLDRTFREA